MLNWTPLELGAGTRKYMRLFTWNYRPGLKRIEYHFKHERENISSAALSENIKHKAIHVHPNTTHTCNKCVYNIVGYYAEEMRKRLGIMTFLCFSFGECKLLELSQLIISLWFCTAEMNLPGLELYGSIRQLNRLRLLSFPELRQQRFVKF